jgi:dihydroflavonol-4-reductase
VGNEKTDGGGGRLRALVTGANGFMGQHMLRVLSDWKTGPATAGYDIVATDIGPALAPASADVPNCRYVQCDLRNDEQVRKLLVGPNYDHVFHIAGLFDYSAAYVDLFDVNVRGSRNLIRALARDDGSLTSPKVLPSRMVVWGAAGVYDFGKESPAKETSPVHPKGGYLTTKYMEEMLMLEEGKRLGIPVTIVRPGGVYGPGSRYGVAFSILLAARGGMGPFYFGPGRTRAGMVHVEDVCRAAAFLARRHEAAGEIYNVNDDSSYRTSDLMRTAARWLGFPLLPINFPLGVMRGFIGNLGKKASKKGRISMLNEEMTDLVAYDALLDASKLKALGWTPKWPDSLVGLKQTITWYEKEGWL